MIEQLIGPEIAGHPVWNLRAKTPHNPLATVPWHQDTAYLAEGSEHTFQPTAWIPLVDANSINGCMQVVRGGHNPPRVYRHKLENTIGRKDSWYLYIDEPDLPNGEIVTCEMNKGSILLLNNLIPHRSTENYSDIIRWSIDLRWQKPGEPSGQEGIKEPILMRTARDPNYYPDWEAWGNVSRQVGMKDVLAERETARERNGRARHRRVDAAVGVALMRNGKFRDQRFLITEESNEIHSGTPCFTRACIKRVFMLAHSLQRRIEHAYFAPAQIKDRQPRRFFGIIIDNSGQERPIACDSNCIRWRICGCNAREIGNRNRLARLADGIIRSMCIAQFCNGANLIIVRI